MTADEAKAASVETMKALPPLIAKAIPALIREAKARPIDGLRLARRFLDEYRAFARLILEICDEAEHRLDAERRPN